MKKTKIAIVIPCWKRSLILSYVFRQFDLFYKSVCDQFDIIVIYVFSENDPELKKILFHYMKSEHPRDYIYSSNELLGQKLNDGIRHAMLYKFDYMMNCGSDDFIHPNIMKLYNKMIAKNEKLFGINRLYFYKDNEDPLFFSGYNKPYVVGAGRMIHKDVIEHVLNVYGGIYRPDIHRGMDTMSSKRMHEIGYIEKTINPGKFPYVIDIKSNVNINSFDKITNSRGDKRIIATADRHFLNRHFKILREYEQQTCNLSAQKIIG